MGNQVAGTYISQQLPFADARSYQLYEDLETATYSRRIVRPSMDEPAAQQFVDPEPLYESGVDLGVRVGLFGQHLRLDPSSASHLQEVSEVLATRTPILDVGCGLGEPLLPVGPTIFDHADVVGGDLSLSQLRSIVERTGPASPVRVARFDAARLPIRSRSVAAVLARHMLYHVPDPRIAAAEAARVLEADGMLVATTNSSRSRPELQDTHREAVRLLEGTDVPRMSRNFDAETGATKLAHSFTAVRAVPWSGVLDFPDLEAVLSYYRSTAYFRMAFNDADRRQRLAEEVTNRLLARCGPNRPALTVAGAVFVCTRPRHS